MKISILKVKSSIDLWCFSVVSASEMLPRDICCFSVTKLCLNLCDLMDYRLRYPWLPPRVCSNSCLFSRWCCLTISSSVAPFSSNPQSFPASRYFPIGWFCASGGQNVGASASASVLPMNTKLILLKLISCLSTLQRHLLIFHSYNSKIPSLFSLGRDFLIHKATVWRFPHGSVSKESACNAGDLALIPGSEISPEEGNDNPLLYLCLGNPMDRGVWWATFHGVTRVAHDLVTKLPPPRVLCSLTP